MGTLRLFLALTVLDWHYRYSESRLFPYSFVAVCCFFIISGFYMSLVINEKYRTDLVRFYLNRALRLYPVNIAVLLALAVVGWFAGAPQFAPFAVPMPLLDRVLAIANQVLIFPGVVWQNLRLTPGTDGAGLFFGQLYTVGLELMFYAVAPLIVMRRPLALAALTVAAVAVHFGLHRVGPSQPWQYEFFPGILAFFMLGSLAYQLLRLVRGWRYPKWLGYLALPAIAAYCVWAHDASIVDFTNGVMIDGLYVLIALAIPFLFEASKSARWDRLIGDLSYPVYVVHILVGSVMLGPGVAGSTSESLRVLVVSLLAAIALLVLVDYPVERWRVQVTWRLRAGGAFRAAAIRQQP